MLRHWIVVFSLILFTTSCQNSSEKQDTTTQEAKTETSSQDISSNSITEIEAETQTEKMADPIAASQTENTVEIRRLPQNIEEFLSVRDKISQTPEGGAAMFIVACMMYVNSSDNNLAPITVAVAKKRLQENTKGYKGYAPNPSDLRLIKDQLKRYPFLPSSYVLGTSPQDGYSLSDKTLKFSFSINKYSGSVDEGSIKLFIPSSGADSPRPIKVSLNDKGLWKADEWSSILVGIRTPPVADNDEL